MALPIKLIVGLANPGDQYASTRHNAGAWFVEYIAMAENIQLRTENKFHGYAANVKTNDDAYHLLVPTTYMNRSGQAVLAMAHFYKIRPEEILIAHDDLDLPPGSIKLKLGGGHGGHNGLRDTFSHLGSQNFYRLRVGIGKPHERTDTTNYVLKAPSKIEKNQIDEALTRSLIQLPDLLAGNIDKAMKAINTK